mgnify:FL=1
MGGGFTPYGYRLEGHSPYRIAEILLEKGYKTRLRTVKKTGRVFGGQPLEARTIYEILKNPLYAGRIIWKKLVLADQMEDQDLSKVLQEVEERLLPSRPP